MGAANACDAAGAHREQALQTQEEDAPARTTAARSNFTVTPASNSLAAALCVCLCGSALLTKDGGQTFTSVPVHQPAIMLLAVAARSAEQAVIAGMGVGFPATQYTLDGLQFHNSSEGKVSLQQTQDADMIADDDKGYALTGAFSFWGSNVTINGVSYSADGKTCGAPEQHQRSPALQPADVRAVRQMAGDCVSHVASRSDACSHSDPLCAPHLLLLLFSIARGFQAALLFRSSILEPPRTAPRATEATRRPALGSCPLVRGPTTRL